VPADAAPPSSSSYTRLSMNCMFDSSDTEVRALRSRTPVAAHAKVRVCTLSSTRCSRGHESVDGTRDRG
jgi:hypothetical protein